MIKLPDWHFVVVHKDERLSSYDYDKKYNEHFEEDSILPASLYELKKLNDFDFYHDHFDESFNLDELKEYFEKLDRIIEFVNEENEYIDRECDDCFNCAYEDYTHVPNDTLELISSTYHFLNGMLDSLYYLKITSDEELKLYKAACEQIQKLLQYRVNAAYEMAVLPYLAAYDEVYGELDRNLQAVNDKCIELFKDIPLHESEEDISVVRDVSCIKYPKEYDGDYPLSISIMNEIAKIVNKYNFSARDMEEVVYLSYALFYILNEEKKQGFTFYPKVVEKLDFEDLQKRLFIEYSYLCLKNDFANFEIVDGNEFRYELEVFFIKCIYEPTVKAYKEKYAELYGEANLQFCNLEYYDYYKFVDIRPVYSFWPRVKQHW